MMNSSALTETTTHYRPDIEGVRAADAVLGELRMIWKGMSFFVIVGIAFLSIAFISEIRRQNDS